MTTPETHLVEALRDHERLAPDPAAVIAGLNAGIARRRRRRRIQGMVAVALATIAAVTAGVVTAGGLADQPTPATSPTPTPAVAQRRSTLTFGWLPAGLNPPVVTSTEVRESVLFPGSGGRYLQLSVSNVPWTPRLDLPGWRQTTINGRPASELSQPDSSSVVFQLPSGRWAQLGLGEGYGNGGNDQPALRNEAIRVANAVRDDGDRRLRAGFTLQYLPTGQRVIGVSTDESATTSFDEVICASGSLHFLDKEEVQDPAGNFFEAPRVDEGQVIAIRLGAPSPALTERQLEYNGQRLPDIEGRKAYAINQGHMVVVLDFHGRQLTVLAASRKATPLAELVKVAAGVRLA